jgi:hypothetical protein
MSPHGAALEGGPTRFEESHIEFLEGKPLSRQV